MTNAIKWRVSDVPRGPYSSFERREWPLGYSVEHERVIFKVSCEDEYVPSRVKEGKHSVLYLYIALLCSEEEQKKFGKWRWVKIKKEFSSLKELKQFAESYAKEKGL